MKCLYLEDGKVRLRHDYPQPAPAPDEALIRVRLAGICATDLELVKGYAGGFTGILGHEFVGEVVDAPQAAHLIGRRVVSSINIGCGDCAACRLGNVEHCARRVVPGIHQRDGVFAEYVALPLSNLFVVPDEIPDEAAVFTEPLAAAVRIREQVHARPTQQTAVVGPGRLGMLVGQVLNLAGTGVTMLGRSAGSLRFPASLGLQTALAADAPARSFDLVVEATGNEAGFSQALRLIRPLGTLVLKSTFHGVPAIDLTSLVVNEITVIGSRCGPFAPALRLLAQRQVAVQPMIDAEYALQEGADALAHAARRGVRKVLLRP